MPAGLLRHRLSYPPQPRVFSPRDLPNLRVWLRADGVLWQDSARTTRAGADGDPVGSWDDASAAGSHATQATAASRPAFKTGILNGQPVLRFAAGTTDPTSDWLSFAHDLMLGVAAATAFVVVKLNTDPPATQAKTGLWCFGLQGASSSTHFPYTDGTIYDKFGTSARKTTVNPSPSLTSSRIYAVVTAPSDWRSYLDGSLLFSTGTNTVSWHADPTLGNAQDTGGGAWLDGDAAEFIIYTAVLTKTQLDQVGGYLSAKYAINWRTV